MRSCGTAQDSPTTAKLDSTKNETLIQLGNTANTPTSLGAFR